MLKKINQCAIWLRLQACHAFEMIAKEDGFGIVEILIILIVLIGMALIFKEKITELACRIFAYKYKFGL